SASKPERRTTYWQILQILRLGSIPGTALQPHCNRTEAEPHQPLYIRYRERGWRAIGGGYDGLLGAGWRHARNGLEAV
ncbi:hypothetical protein, partial [Bifidobacterium vespertilionis]|uniref:hypothetical protein n=1 Tax=Bifidobacterium vespertilionis TaxID=2562524 RepID=UPI001CC27F7A